jgi:hypothetical protein
LNRGEFLTAPGGPDNATVVQIKTTASKRNKIFFFIGLTLEKIIKSVN